jgi:sirohydrochlorin cobaltochelatase
LRSGPARAIVAAVLSHRDSALIIVGHGSTVNPDSSAPTLDHVENIRARGIFAEVHPAFWKEEPSLRQVLHMVEAQEVYVVPNFISEGYFTRTVIPRELELDGPITQLGGRVIKYCEPVGSHSGMTELLLRRAQEAAPGVPPQETTLFIVGHGTDLNDNSAAAAKREVEQIAARGVYAEVLNAYMEEAPLIAEWDQLASRPNVVVVPFFIADGLHSYQDIPVLLGIEAEIGAAASQRSIFRRNPYHLRRRTLYFASSIGTEPAFADLIVEQVAAFDAAHTGELAEAR